MKVKLKRSYRLEDNEMDPILFEKDDEVEVVHTFEDQGWGLDDHTVYVVLNEEGCSMSLSAEVVEVLI